jgi:hypothetical protein
MNLVVSASALATRRGFCSCAFCDRNRKNQRQRQACNKAKRNRKPGLAFRKAPASENRFILGPGGQISKSRSRCAGRGLSLSQQLFTNTLRKSGLMTTHLHQSRALHPRCRNGPYACRSRPKFIRSLPSAPICAHLDAPVLRGTAHAGLVL